MEKVAGVFPMVGKWENGGWDLWASWDGWDLGDRGALRDGGGGEGLLERN